jgi:hypothetical protein
MSNGKERGSAQALELPGSWILIGASSPGH